MYHPEWPHRLAAWLISLALLLLASSIAIPAALAQSAPPPKVMRWLAQEKSAHVGQVLPFGIMVMNIQGQSVDLRKTLDHGPLLLVKLLGTPSEQATQQVVQSINDRYGPSSADQNPRIALLILTSTSVPTPLEIPDSVLQLFSADSMDTGFLGGHITPVTFHFDKDLRLVNRVPGWRRDGAWLTHPPGKSQSDKP